MRPKIVLFGDSITESSFDQGGWGCALASHFSRTVDVVLRGYSGYNSRWALEVMERVFEVGDKEAAAAPLAVTVFFGANDASLADRRSAFQHVPLHEYERNLHAIVSYIKKRHPFGDNHDGLPERTNESAGAYAKACVSVSNESGCPVVDLWTKMQQFPDWEKAFLSDGLHLTPRGNRIVFEEVAEALGRWGISPDTLPIDLPSLHDIDHHDPLKCFRK